MKDYKTLLFDLDDTLLDFGHAEQTALKKVLEYHGVTSTPQHFSMYKEINRKHWEMLEQDLITKEDVLKLRHERFFSTLGFEVDGHEVDNLYRSNIAEYGTRLFDGALDLLHSLSHHHDLYIITNGVKETQEARLLKSGLQPYFFDVFISEDTGYQKPMKAFFEHVAMSIPGFRHDEALIVGDSLTSDIKGGINSGIDTCWFNPDNHTNPHSYDPDYTVRRLDELTEILNY